MNAKRAKRLRKQAEQMTVGEAERSYITPTAHDDPKRKVKSQGVAFVHPETTRGVYLALKRGQLQRFMEFVK